MEWDTRVRLSVHLPGISVDIIRSLMSTHYRVGVYNSMIFVLVLFFIVCDTNIVSH